MRNVWHSCLLEEWQSASDLQYLKGLASKFPSGWETQLHEHRSDKFRSGSHLPIEKTVIEITTVTQQRCDPTFTPAEVPNVRLCVGEHAAVLPSHKQRSSFCAGFRQGRSVQKKDQGVSQALAPGPRIAKG